MTNLSKIQKLQKEFILSRKWERFSPTEVFAHLIEELGEVSSYFLYDSGYKIAGAGHKSITKENLATEFAQAFNLFLQLAIHAGVDLENAWFQEYEKNKTRFSKEEWEDIAKKAQNKEF